MSDNIINNEQNQDQDAPNQPNVLIAEDINPIMFVANPAAGSHNTDHYPQSNNGPPPPIVFDIKLVSNIDSTINVSSTGGNNLTIKTSSYQLSLIHGASPDLGLIRVQINSPAANDRESSDTLRCGICLGNFNQLEDLRATACGHMFCGNCLQQALSVTANCPTCRNPQEYANSIRLYS
ncbi:peroxisome biogenesis factor 10-like [Drosophila guanche]|uniref:Blast:LON peptidase N-terminal domain and RING finger protein C14F5.10c n=1 Tax=Drosophila guanche TaxID=7266 RepID=A0A3B0K3Q9_DROGU|nr:peroxisome biogenesis factor 10-like [Drosophila guanche]SPP80256.1 blast:LON peptidase N-terminal domain and RING finger protein C14F5.10c [Drosophila guanche]